MFATDTSTTIHLDGILYEMKHHDFNDDGQVDMAFKTFSPGIVNTVPLLVGSILTKTVPEDLKFFRMMDGSYPNKPSTTRKNPRKARRFWAAKTIPGDADW